MHLSKANPTTFQGGFEDSVKSGRVPIICQALENHASLSFRNVGPSPHFLCDIYVMPGSVFGTQGVAVLKLKKRYV